MSDRITPDSFFSDTHAFHGVGGTTTVRLSSLVFSFRLLKFFRSAKNRERSEGKRKNNFHFGPSVVTQLFGELFFFSSSLPIIFRKQRQKRTDDALRRALVNFVLTCTFC
jgi:hypothetical protein